MDPKGFHSRAVADPGPKVAIADKGGKDLGAESPKSRPLCQ